VPEYLAYVMYLNATITKFDGLVTGVTIPHLTGEKLKGLKSQTPPLNLQMQFADFIRQSDKAKSELQNSLIELEATYKPKLPTVL